MEKEKQRTIAYLCPKCRQPVIQTRSVFALNAAAVTLSCSCGGSSLRIDRLGDHFQIEAPCVFCGGEHRADCGADAFLKRGAVAFSCGQTGAVCCCVGEEARVRKEAERMKAAADKAEGEGAFLDEIIMQEALSELKEMAARGGISCACGSKKYGIKVHFSSVELQCGECGAKMMIPAATEEDLENLCCRWNLIIGSK